MSAAVQVRLHRLDRMASAALTREESWGLAISVAGHAALLAVLLLQPASDDIVLPPERVEVTISEDVGLKSTSPDPSAQAAPDRAPELGEPAPEAAAPSLPQVAPAPAPLPPAPAPRKIEAPEPRPLPRPETKRPESRKPEPRKIEARKPEPRKPPVRQAAPPRPAAKPKPSAIDRIARPSSTTSTPATSTAKPAARTSSTQVAASKAKTPPRKAGASSFDEAFKSGTPGARDTASTGAPAAAVGPQQLSALNSAIGRQLKPHWRGKAPEGADAELLVTRVRFRLNREGGLSGEPQVLSTSGQTDANAAQVARHQEQAVRAVRLAAPFDLPEDLYDGWKVVTTNFDRKLSQ